MTKQFITYEQAVQLKELGFNEECFAKYNKDNFKFNTLGDPKNYNDGTYGFNLISAPLWQQAFDWIRKTYLLHSSVDFNRLKEVGDVDIELYEYKINEQWCVGKEFYDFSYGFRHIKCESHFRTYEEARLECLKTLISIIQNKD